jgi:hypothetical protein
MRRLGCLLALLLVPSARADEVSGTRGTVLERRHEVEVVLYPGHARMTVRRTVENLGQRHDQALFDLEFPQEMAATGLRTRGLLDGRPHWFPGVLMEAEAAARKYQRLTGIGGAYPKDPALLSWRDPGHLLLQVFPVPPAEQKTIEYTLTAPTEYEGGRHRLVLPRLGAAGLAPRVVVRSGSGDDLFVDGRPFPSGGALDWAWVEGERIARVETDESDREEVSVELALAPRHPAVLDGRLAMKEAGQGRTLVRYRVEAARRLSALPRRAQVVVVLDASRSRTDEQRSAALTAARAYLERFEDAEVQVLTFARQTEARFPRFLPVAEARAQIGALPVNPANGSNFDGALALADRLLAARPPGARRVLLLTDLLTREALTPAGQRRALARSGALLHIGVVEGGTPALEVRDDPWSTVARATGGLVWDADADPEGQVEEAGKVFEEWVRPIRLHAFTVESPALRWIAHEPPDTLAEGTEATFIGLTTTRPSPVEVRGELWARPVHLTLRVDHAETRVWSALVFGTEVRDELSEPEMMVLARHGRAVSPVTSYLAIEPGVRPSTEGLEEGQSGYGRGAGGLGGMRARSPFVPPSFDHQGYLSRAVSEAWRTCGGSGGVRATIESTLAEIVEVDARGSDQASALACLREAIWALELPEQFQSHWDRWSVVL